MADDFDLVVLGGGPGGYVAAIRASQLKLKVALVERVHLGGVCLNWGCIPTKALLRSAEVYQEMLHAEEYGLTSVKLDFDLNKIIARSREVAARLASGVKTLLRKNKVTVISGEGRLTDSRQVIVKASDGTEHTLKAKDVIVATGARARQLPTAPADGKRIWTYHHALKPPMMPKRLLVIGSGAIGMEFASFYADFGADVTIVEHAPQILPLEDAEVSAYVAKAFQKRGIRILTKSTLHQLSSDDEGVTADIVGADGQTLQERFSHAIVAIGVVANVEDIGLEKLGVKLERGFIATDGFGRTNVKNVWAIGDVAGAPCLAHKASHQGVIAAEAIAGIEHARPLDIHNIPGCTYARPQVASVGLTEEKARQQGFQIKVGNFPFIANGKAIAQGSTDGFVKTIFDSETGALLGAHMVGAEVTEMIQGYTVARTLETTEAEIMESIFPHPTLSEAMHESVLAAYGRALHY
ncbi:dihydrolipoyl dehydrogenase [Zymomonas mobilis]|uniref:Dihydrolipoyl dehydrogenase n=1 Tax=Zymomonas mobilis subsp. pomaceae (strain ATCC 29192 / DSM 22645 / JCM 10191 / CCUG 17912 / NBRC 13757 / NCIMB 11200 / NRRL B-4491 / Barker I) TaxID=579138 RepID=F8ES33_ZYMMT|nr:dihydrolipoyl dehydrogenase [Zymomonas mobilis]AEI37608.1 dihydrolipoamide dehydrogenase [Zymomonas mobilis subsp. pomaceae ATCC 29192]MDX5948976.1 dihydrolipoyl dehydrogenase [Zymomonas mobilis subsp. pomaceae]GEB88781.1 dihydrolipoyl dehydrogenase [Zymomonas mobilis subsp. pomaceae]